MAEKLDRTQTAALRLFSRKLALVGLYLLAGYLIWQTRYVFVLIYVAAILAAGIAPAVRRVQVYSRKWFRRRIRKGAAVLLVYLPFLLSAILIAIFTIPALTTELSRMSEELPEMIDSTFLEPARQFGLPIDNVVKGFKRSEAPDESSLMSYLTNTVVVVTSIVAVLFMIVYMLIDTNRLKSLFLLFFPADDRSNRAATVRRVSRRMSNWLGGQLILAVIVGLATLVGALAIGVPYAIPLAIIATIGEVVPVIGPIIGAVPLCLIALLESPRHFWMALGLAIIIQQVENYLLVPRLMGKQVSISPLAVFIAFLFGATLFGIIGAILAVPTAAIAQVIFEESFLQHRERRSRGRVGAVLATDRK